MTAELGGQVRYQLATAAAGQVVVLVISRRRRRRRLGRRPADRRRLRRYPVRPARPGRPPVRRWSSSAGRRRARPGELFTLTRAVLVGGVTALVVDRFAAGNSNVRLLVVVATVALLLDASTVRWPAGPTR